jgi:predicted aconitase/predicted aconitase with swiveling domain
MGSLQETIWTGTAYVQGRASAKLLASNLELSFWGGVDPQTSEVIDRHHPLSGQHLQNTVLAIPGGRGSCTGSGVMLELLLNGKAPEAIIFERREDILTLGVMIAEEVFQQSIPVLVLKKKDFQRLLELGGQMIYVDDGHISTAPILPKQTDSARDPESGLILEAAPALEGIKLSTLDQELLRGDYGEASRVAFRIVLRMAHLLGATRLMDITQVHVDGCVYTGPATLALAERLRDLGGKVRVPTTLNSISVDQKRWRALGVDTAFGEAADALGKAYVDMGAKPTYTCAPYQLESAPKLGEQVAWAESNAVVYANSVLGARTMKYPDFLDISIALTGRAPKGGPHIDTYRLASVRVDIVGMENVPDLDDSFPPLLGYYVGTLSISRIPVLTGLETYGLSTDDLKAFGAAFATVSSAPMFHIAGVTPEATTLENVVSSELTTFKVKPSDLVNCWDKLNSAPINQSIDLVSLGNPHFSLSEIRKLASLCRGRRKATSVAVVVTCGRSIHKLAEQAGYSSQLEEFGVQVLTDTCWCMVTEPVIPRAAKTIMTNSGKYAHYGPGLTGRGMYFGSLAACVDAACQGRHDARRPRWLQLGPDI